MNIKTTIKQLKARIIEYDDNPLEKYGDDEIRDLIDDLSDISDEFSKIDALKKWEADIVSLLKEMELKTYRIAKGNKDNESISPNKREIIDYIKGHLINQ